MRPSASYWIEKLGLTTHVEGGAFREVYRSELIMPRSNLPLFFQGDRNVSTSFINDAVGVRLRHDIGVDRMLWSSDYPHLSANWPFTTRMLQATFLGAGVTPDEAYLMTAGNSARLYG